MSMYRFSIVVKSQFPVGCVDFDVKKVHVASILYKNDHCKKLFNFLPLFPRID